MTALMGPGVDPHLYKATEGDVQRLQEADIIFYNGLHLEAQMGDVLEKLNEHLKWTPEFAMEIVGIAERKGLIQQNNSLLT